MEKFYKPLPDSLTIKNSSIEGLGLFSTKFIAKGTNLGITHVKDNRFPNGYSRTPLGGFFNHSETPNCEVKYEEDFIFLITLADITEGEELTAKYTFYNPSLK
jgi:SET domain-containing protein